MRVSVCIPEGLVRASADLARRLGMTRGALYGRAIEEYMASHADDVHINPLIKAHVEPVLIEEMEREAPRGAAVASQASHGPAIEKPREIMSPPGQPGSP